jgi:hypothetical protein
MEMDQFERSAAVVWQEDWAGVAREKWQMDMVYGGFFLEMVDKG